MDEMEIGMINRLRSATVAFYGIAASTIIPSSTAAETSSHVLISKIPLREGLTIVVAHSDPARGDYEPILTVTRVDAKAITVTISTDEPSRCTEQVRNLDGRRSISRRSILREDLARAHTYRHGFTECALEPELTPGMTGLSLSTSVLRELKTTGRTNLRAHTKVAGMLAGVLTRLESQPVPFKVILNDESVEVAAVHARWHSSAGDRDYWILDDIDNALVLRMSYNGKPFHEIVKVSFPTDEKAAHLERDLSEQGRTVTYGIYFEFSSDRVKEESAPVLNQIADLLTRNPTWRLSVEGHTDNLGGTEANLRLSQRRAASVRKVLGERYKIEPTRLEPAGFGETRPKATNGTLEGRALNRRVELVRIGR
jgi:outer membrane protein OmpA-like peptidoglycan-associated protein